MSIRRIPAHTRVAGLLGCAAALVALAPPAAAADVPPSNKIYARSQTWTCPGLGVFEALYSAWGQNPHVKWLSPDGGREDAVQVTIVSADVYLTLDGVTYHFSGPTNPPAREGEDHYDCAISGRDGADSITGTTTVAVIPRA